MSIQVSTLPVNSSFNVDTSIDTTSEQAVLMSIQVSALPVIQISAASIGTIRFNLYLCAMKKQIVIAIDGYASCGKSTIAKQLAKRLGYIYIDSGAMYRAVTLYFLQNNIALDNTTQIETALANINIDFRWDEAAGFAHTYLNNQDIEQAIRSKEVTQNVSKISAIAQVRHFLVVQQQLIGKNKGIVMDGRDIGTVVFPTAELKLFMTADINVRAKRRFAELQTKGIEMSLEEIKINLAERDHLDSTRTESPLRKADDAIVIDNSNLSPTEQLDIAVLLAENRNK
jgi:cytidylate kinase